MRIGVVEPAQEVFSQRPAFVGRAIVKNREMDQLGKIPAIPHVFQDLDFNH